MLGRGKRGMAKTDFRATAISIVQSAAFRRLYGVSFLGILSPKYRDLPQFPSVLARGGQVSAEQTRAHHSVAVAYMAFDAVSRLGFSKQVQRYATVWGLCHDIATWPLSHTGEAAFSQTTGIGSQSLREMMVKGDSRLPDRLSLFSAIRDAGVNHEVILALFDKQSVLPSEELDVFSKLIHSEINPDTFEGMNRSGRVFGVPMPRRSLFGSLFGSDLLTPLGLGRKGTETALAFWRGKSRIYRDFINSNRTVEFESRWSVSIRNIFAKHDLVRSLDLSEVDLLYGVVTGRLDVALDVVRYKAPHHYTLGTEYMRRRALDGGVPVDKLREIFVKVEK